MTVNQERAVVGGGIVVIVILILLLAMRKAAPAQAGDIVTDQYTITPTYTTANPPAGYNVSVVMTAPDYGQSGGCDCGCDDTSAFIGTLNDLTAFYAKSLTDTQTAYNAQLLEAIPEYLLQYWNNPQGYIDSQTAQGYLS